MKTTINAGVQDSLTDLQHDPFKKISHDPHDLEAALPTLINKLKLLQEKLLPEEEELFEEIIRSAASYTELTQEARANGAQYSKPISAIATFNMKKQIIKLPTELNI